MSEQFIATWEAMSVTERIDHLLADWKSCHATRDVMVLQIAAAVSHHVLQQAGAEIKRLHSETLSNNRRIGEQDAIMAELWERIHALTAERNEARREVCRWSSFYYEEHSDVNEGPPRARDLEEAERRGWDCFKEKGK